jgi:hypothetical protein
VSKKGALKNNYVLPRLHTCLPAGRRRQGFSKMIMQRFLDAFRNLKRGDDAKE